MIKKDPILLVGIGRSGTTWVGDIINHKKNYRVLFEPFFPDKVSEAKGFEYIQYLHPSIKNTELSIKSLNILKGNIKSNSWVDRDNEITKKYRNIIVKDIRCNLMLGWLQKVSDFTPTILVIRHPLQVLSSWKKLDWIDDQWVSEEYLDDILSKTSLLRDFPIITKVFKQIDSNDYVQNFVFRWCVFNLVPLTHLDLNKAYILFYENLVTDFKNEATSLFKYLREPLNLEDLEKIFTFPSSTNFNNRNFKKDKSELINNWKYEYSTKQIEVTKTILEAFDLNYLYDSKDRPTLNIKS